MGKQKVEKCICGAVAELRTRNESFFGGKIIVKGQEYFRCKHGHEYLTSEQATRFEKQFKNQYFIQRQIIETGRSLAITLPRDFVDFYNLKKGSRFIILPHGKKEAIIRFN